MPVDRNHDIVPSLRMMGGFVTVRAAEEIEGLRKAYRESVTKSAKRLLIVGPGWNDSHEISNAIQVEGCLTVTVDDGAPWEHASKELGKAEEEIARLQAALFGLTEQSQWRAEEIQRLNSTPVWKLAWDRLKAKFKEN